MNPTTKQQQYEDILKEMETHKASRDKYYELAFKADRLNSELKKENKQATLLELKHKTKFIECVYPDMGILAEDGSAVFEDEETAKALVSVLISDRGYYYGYKLEWEGLGYIS